MYRDKKDLDYTKKYIYIFDVIKYIFGITYIKVNKKN